MASVTAPSSSTSASYLIHNLHLRLPEPPCSVSLIRRPLSFFSASISQSSHRRSRRLRCQSLSSNTLPSSSSIDEPNLGGGEEEESEDEEDYSAEEYEEDSEVESGMVPVRGGIEDSEKTEKKKKAGRGSGLKLTIKEKKELASYAHSLGDKLKCQLVGKSGVTDSVVFSFLETLEKNELLKVKIRKTSPEEMEDAVNHLEEATGSVAVGQIGRTVILYRPSPTKMKAEEKKKEVERLLITRRHKFTNSRPTTTRPPFRREYQERPDGRGRRGGSRVATD
ncbi:RNA-binding CRS1 / YhbY [Hirschfeldia incana]|nr:RNA-binding CRS1 / YhbY [Hirschfeldia incana]